MPVPELFSEEPYELALGHFFACCGAKARRQIEKGPQVVRIEAQERNATVGAQTEAVLRGHVSSLVVSTGTGSRLAVRSPMILRIDASAGVRVLRPFSSAVWLTRFAATGRRDGWERS